MPTNCLQRLVHVCSKPSKSMHMAAIVFVCLCVMTILTRLMFLFIICWVLTIFFYLKYYFIRNFVKHIVASYCRHASTLTPKRFVVGLSVTAFQLQPQTSMRHSTSTESTGTKIAVYTYQMKERNSSDSRLIDIFVMFFFKFLFKF